MRVLPFPSSVTLPPPSSTVSTLMAFSEVTVIVAFDGPQSNVITPPLAMAASRAASLHPSGEPLPTTALGDELSAGLIGSWHVGGGTMDPPVPPPDAPTPVDEDDEIPAPPAPPDSPLDA